MDRITKPSRTFIEKHKYSSSKHNDRTQLSAIIKKIDSKLARKNRMYNEATYFPSAGMAHITLLIKQDRYVEIRTGSELFYKINTNRMPQQIEIVTRKGEKVVVLPDYVSDELINLIKDNEVSVENIHHVRTFNNGCIAVQMLLRENLGVGSIAKHDEQVKKDFAVKQALDVDIQNAEQSLLKNQHILITEDVIEMWKDEKVQQDRNEVQKESELRKEEIEFLRGLIENKYVDFNAAIANSINEKLYEIIGDVCIDLDNRCIYEDYIENCRTIIYD